MTEQPTPNAVFSPSATLTWKDCPVKWMWQRQGLTSRYIGNRDLAGLLGSAYSQALHIHYRSRQAGVETYLPSALTAGLGYIVAQREAWRDEGRQIPESHASQDAALEGRFERIVARVLDHDPIPPSWTIVAVEEPLPEAGNARPDLVVRDDMGELVVVDHKCKLTFGRTASERTRKRQYAMNDWRYSDQMYHYLRYTGAQRFAIALAEVEPTPHVELLDPVYVTPEQMAAWEAGQRHAWTTMALHKQHPELAWRAGTHYDQFGPCEYHTICFGDPIQREAEYTVRIRV